MCNAYSITTNVEAIRDFVQVFEIATDIGNLPPQTGIYPDILAPIVRNRDGFRELTKVRWGMPSSSRALYEAAQKRAQKVQAKQGRDLTTDEFAELVRMEPDRGVTNVRNTDSLHWKRWLDPKFRCVVPFTSFAEFDNTTGPDGRPLGNTWFAFTTDRPLAFFAGIWAPQWTSVRKVRDGLVTTDLFAFLTTEPNDVVGSIHMKAMPVILTTPGEVETWLMATWEEAKKLQRPLPNGTLRIVAVGGKEDPEEKGEPPDRDRDKMDYDTQIAHHEAAHVVVSCAYGLASPDGGIDLHRVSVPDARGAAVVNIFALQPGLPEDERGRRLIANLSIVLAGPAADARTRGRTPVEAMAAQGGDLSRAVSIIDEWKVLSGTTAAELKEEREFLIEAAYTRVASLLARPEIWARVENVARAAIANAGKLSQQEITALLP